MQHHETGQPVAVYAACNKSGISRIHFQPFLRRTMEQQEDSSGGRVVSGRLTASPSSACPVPVRLFRKPRASPLPSSCPAAPAVPEFRERWCGADICAEKGITTCSWQRAHPSVLKSGGRILSCSESEAFGSEPAFVCGQERSQAFAGSVLASVWKPTSRSLWSRWQR